MTPAEIHTLRLRLTDVRQAQRQARRDADAREAGLALTVEGRNETERKARLTLALAADPEYLEAMLQFEIATRRTEQLQADIARFEDERREREWAIRDRWVAALAGRSLPDEVLG